MLDDLNAHAAEIREIDDGLTIERIGKIRDTEESPDEQQALLIGDPDTLPPAWRADAWGEDGALACCARALEGGAEREAVRREAAALGLMIPGCGVSLGDLPKLMEAFAAHRAVERLEEATLSDLGALLMDCECVLCPVCAALLEDPDAALFPGMNADCVVVVAALNMDDPLNIRLSLLHPEREAPEMDVELPVFMAAWQAGGSCAFGLG